MIYVGAPPLPSREAPTEAQRRLQLGTIPGVRLHGQLHGCLLDHRQRSDQVRLVLLINLVGARKLFLLRPP